MRGWLLTYLVCPVCRSDVTCTPAPGTDDELESGSLTCGGCGRSYPIRAGVPRMLPDHVEPEQARTADAFGWQWLTFNRLHEGWEEYESRFLDWIAPLDRTFLAGKVVLDAGCGMGEFTAAAARLGAGRVIGVDLSQSVDAARSFTRDLPNVGIVQADIYHLPFRDPFDFAFSIGVVHHLPDPAAGLQALGSHVKPDGTLYAWVYGHENNGWVRHIVTPLRRHVTSRLPRIALYGLSFLLALVLQPTLRLLYQSPAGGMASRLLPYYSYLHWLSQYGFRHNHCVIFDHLNAPTAAYVRREEFKAWFERAGFGDVRLSWRNQNSWRGFGRRSGSSAPRLGILASA